MCSLLTGLYYFSIGITGLYFSSYLINDAGVPYSFLGTINMIAIFFVIVFTPVWNRVIHKYSWFRSVSIALLINSLYYFTAAYVNGNNYLFLYPLACFMTYVAGPGISIVMSNMQYLHLPETERNGYLSYFMSFNSFMTMTGAFFGRKFIVMTQSAKLRIFGQTLINKQYLLFITGSVVLTLSAMFILLRKQEHAEIKAPGHQA